MVTSFLCLLCQNKCSCLNIIQIQYVMIAFRNKLLKNSIHYLPSLLKKKKLIQHKPSLQRPKDPRSIVKDWKDWTLNCRLWGLFVRSPPHSNLSQVSHFFCYSSPEPLSKSSHSSRIPRALVLPFAPVLVLSPSPSFQSLLVFRIISPVPCTLSFTVASIISQLSPFFHILQSCKANHFLWRSYLYRWGLLLAGLLSPWLCQV